MGRPEGLQFGIVNDVELRLISKPKPLISLRKSAEDIEPAKVHKESDDESSSSEEPLVPSKMRKGSDDESSEEEAFVPHNEHQVEETETAVAYEDIEVASASGSEI